MLPMWLWSIATHHSEAVDPELLEWIKDRLDHILNLGPWTAVAALALIILLIPLSIIIFYLIQQRRQAAAQRTLPEAEDG